MSDHRPVRIWQERPGEFSYSCACGMVMKHQMLRYGRALPWPRCLDDDTPQEDAPELVRVWSSDHEYTFVEPS